MTSYKKAIADFEVKLSSNESKKFHNDDEQQQGIPLLTLTELIDKSIKDKNRKKIGLTKIDAEGFEYEILRGLEKNGGHLICSGFLDKLRIEFAPELLEAQGTPPYKLLYWLRRYGFSIFEEETEREITPANMLYHHIGKLNQQNDVL